MRVVTGQAGSLINYDASPHTVIRSNLTGHCAIGMGVVVTLW